MIKVGITGQPGFVGTHLYNTLGLYPGEFERVLFEDDYFVDVERLKTFVKSCDVIVHLAAVNRHTDAHVLYETNMRLVKQLIEAMEATNSRPYVLFSSSIQEERDNEYGRSKSDGRKLLEEWAVRNGASFTGMVVPNVFGPFGKPNYNSFIATFGYKLTHGDSPTVLQDNEVNLIYVGSLCRHICDKIREMGSRTAPSLVERDDVACDFEMKVSEVLGLFENFKKLYFEQGIIPPLNNIHEMNLFNTFRSYIDMESYFPAKLVQHTDVRGSFVETVKIGVGGQVSFSTTVPGVTRGNHYHTRKMERFVVIKGKARIQLRKVGTDEVLDYYLNGEEPAYVDMPVWYTHNISNIGDEILYAQFWINESKKQKNALFLVLYVKWNELGDSEKSKYRFMERLKVLSVVGTRPEIIRLSCVLQKLDASPAIEHVLVHTGQNYDYELNEIFFQDLGLRKPDYFLNAAGNNATTTAGQILINIDPVLEEVRPDAFLVLGDTNSCLCAIAAKKRHIPIFHMEAGNRCFDQRVPEESNRKIVDHISDINLPYSSIAREYLLSEGIPSDRVIKTGSPMYEVLNRYLPQINASSILENLGLEKGKYFVVSAHREENISSERNFGNLVKILNDIAQTYGFPVIVSTHPRTRKKIETDGVEFQSLIRLMKPMGFSDYNKLQINAKTVISDSGTISEEASILNFKALNIREAHERPEAMEEASVMMVGLNPERVMQGLSELQNQNLETRNFRPVADYSIPNVSDKVVRIILSYTDYVKRVVWGER